jgi:hypothetical protein
MIENRNQVWALELELRRRDTGAEALRRETKDVWDLYAQSQLEVADALRMVDAFAVLPEVVRAQQQEARLVAADEKVNELRQILEQRDERICELEKELYVTKKDLAGVCWVQAQLLGSGTQ